MSDTSPATDTIVERDDLGDGDAALWEFWTTQDAIAGKEEDKWIKKGRNVIKRYRAEGKGENAPHSFNILWSNVQTLIPTLYARTPKADVQRRFLDQDDTGRLASTLLERALSYTLEHTGFDALMSAVVEDRLLPGRGTARVMYVPHFGDPIEEFDEAEAEDTSVASVGDEAEPTRRVDYEEAVAKYTYWEDYREGPARTWREVPWTRYRAYMDRDALVKRFGKKGRQVNLDTNPRGTESKDSPPDIYKKAEIFEFWDKTKKQVIWLAPGTPDIILDKQDDPLKLPDFFPSPDPLLSTTTTSNRIPIPDYVEYQDQANELDVLTGRIDRLTRALKISGVYPGSLKYELQQLIDSDTENKLIPVADWQGWADKGGLDNFIQWMPIKQIAEVLIQLYEAREKTKGLLYEITGIGDIMRGQTNPNETMGAQQLKANFSTRRIQPQQQKVARFARDIIRLLAGVIAEQFQPQTISMITGYPQLAPVPPVPPEPSAMIPGQPQGAPPGMQPPGVAPVQPPQMQPNPAHDQWMQAMQAAQQVQQANAQKQQQFEAACALIKSDGVRGFKLDIEADSTIAPDEQAEKQARVEFLQQMIPMLQQVVPIAQGNPPLAEMASQMVLFAMRGFRVARPLEEAFETGFAAIAKMAPVQKPGEGKSGPDPAIEQAKIQAEMHNTQMKAQAQQADTQAKTQTAMLDTQARSDAAAHDAQLQAQTQQLAIAQKAQQAQLQAQAAAERAAMEDQHHREKMGLEIEKMHSAERLAEARTAATEAKSAGKLV